MNCVIGIDGGGTKTRLKAVDFNQNVLVTLEGKTSNMCSNGHETIRQNMKELIEACIQALPAEAVISRVCIGSAGVVSDEGRRFYEELLQDLTQCQNIRVENDGYIALFANPEHENRISITAGTGSICLGKTKGGQSTSSGGWGHVFSDDGSAYAIATDALRHSFYAFDEMGPQTLLLPSVLEYLESATPGEATMKILAQDFGKDKVAMLAPLVEKAARHNDEVAIKILEKAATQLFLMCESVLKKLELENEPVAINFNGSVLQKNDFVKQKVQSLILNKYSQVEIMTCDIEAVWGAVYLALQ